MKTAILWWTFLLLMHIAFSADIDKDVDEYINNLQDFMEKDGLSIMKGLSLGAATLDAFEVPFAGLIGKVLDLGIEKLDSKEVLAYEKLRTVNKKLVAIEKQIRELHDQLSPADAIYDLQQSIVDEILTLREAYYEEVVTPATVNKAAFENACKNPRPNAVLSKLKSRIIDACRLPRALHLKNLASAHEIFNLAEKSLSCETNAELDEYLDHKNNFISNIIHNENDDDVEQMLLDLQKNIEAVHNDGQFFCSNVTKLVKGFVQDGAGDIKCYLKAIYVSNKFKRHALLDGLKKIALHLIELKSLSIACSTTAANRTERLLTTNEYIGDISTHMLKLYDHLLTNSWPSVDT